MSFKRFILNVEEAKPQLLSLDDPEIVAAAHMVAFHSALIEIGKADDELDVKEKKWCLAYLKSERKKALKTYMDLTDKVLDQ